MSYAQQRLTWAAKAQDTTRVLHWVLRQGPKPDLVPPKMLAPGLGPSPKNAATHAGSQG